MFFSSFKIKKIFSCYKYLITNTGNAAGQIAILTFKINTLTNHLKINKKDKHSKLGLIKITSRRKRLLKYLNSYSLREYHSLLTKLELKK